VHKSQGSEYDEIAFVPAPGEHPLARRELVYTAVTRAKRAVVIWGGWPALRQAAAQPMARRGTLGLRLR
jgi:exodeoxyribonuclease V alpha subunit